MKYRNKLQMNDLTFINIFHVELIGRIYCKCAGMPVANCRLHTCHTQELID